MADISAVCLMTENTGRTPIGKARRRWIRARPACLVDFDQWCRRL